jgi:hypothetical protein
MLPHLNSIQPNIHTFSGNGRFPAVGLDGRGGWWHVIENAAMLVVVENKDSLPEHIGVVAQTKTKYKSKN